jgi:hypothetical protein
VVGGQQRGGEIATGRGVVVGASGLTTTKFGRRGRRKMSKRKEERRGPQPSGREGVVVAEEERQCGWWAVWPVARLLPGTGYGSNRW